MAPGYSGAGLAVQRPHPKRRPNRTSRIDHPAGDPWPRRWRCRHPGIARKAAADDTGRCPAEGTVLAAGRERGIAMFAALWASAILAVVVLSVLQLVRADARLGRGREDLAELGAVADAAVNITVLALLGPAAAQWPVNGAAVGVPFAGHDVQVSVRAPTRQLRPDETGEPILRQMPPGAGLDGEAARRLAESIVTWRQ